MERIFVGRGFPANRKIVWDKQCRRVLFCYHCELPILTSNGEVPKDFRCPNCKCPYFQTLEDKIKEERDLDEFRERVKQGNISWNEAKIIASLESLRYMPR